MRFQITFLCVLFVILFSGIALSQTPGPNEIPPGPSKTLHAVRLAEPVVILSAKAMRVPSKDRETFFRELLKLNYSGLLHGAYAIDGDYVVLIDTLEYDTLDKGEFEASLDAIGFALSEHYPLLSRYMDH